MLWFLFNCFSLAKNFSGALNYKEDYLPANHNVNNKKNVVNYDYTQYFVMLANPSLNIELFYFISLYLYIHVYPPDSQESDGGANT